MKKTNAARIMDKSKIKYKLIEYKFDEDNLSAAHIANELNQNLSQVFKTLVLRGDKNGFLVAVIPGDKEINLKKLAKASANKKVEMIHVKELLGISGYIRGGCSPIGMKKKFPTFINFSCHNFNYIMISAGIRGMQFEIITDDLIGILDAQVVDICI